AQLITFSFVMLASSYLMIKPDAIKLEGTSERRLYKIIVDGLVVGLITGFVGVGGGFLIVPALVLLMGLPIRIAIGTSMFIIFLKSTAGFLKYVEVLEVLDLALDYEIIFLFSIVGIMGSYLGKYASNKIPQSILKKGFGGFLIIVGGFILTKSVIELST
ncbi:MAG: putative membrane protein YfcA, partial [Candidatus Azotimanducaceae bacterium]